MKRTALVTGANRGLGTETCRQLARSGLLVLLTGRSESAGAAAASALAKEGLAVEYRPLDVADPKSIASLKAGLAGSPIDVLVNNAGIAMDGFDAEVARRTLDVNFFGALGVTNTLLPLLPDGGTIVMVSSGMGELACLGAPLREKMMEPGLTQDELIDLMHAFVRDVEHARHTEAGWPSSAYRVSKAGLNALVRILARDLAGRRIRVNAVCPGWVRTDMGGPKATRSVEIGAASIVWAASEKGPTGGFFRDGKSIAW
jgi:NAD(P)-dependent dehydrogenase (short-subunit alcohol dehydrogenase family)